MHLHDVSIVMLWFNRLSVSRVAVGVLIEEIRDSGAELIIVDNGSSDGSSELLKCLAEDVSEISVLYNDRNLGVAEGRNCGLRMAKRPFILSLDNDIVIKRSVITNLLRKMRSQPELAILSPRIEDYRTGKLMNAYAVREGEIISFYEGCFMMRASILKTVGWLDEECFYAGEGLDYGLRVTDAGYSMRSMPAVRVKHIAERSDDGVGDGVKRLRWAKAFARVYAKNLPLVFAVQFCFRNVISHVWWGVVEGEVCFLRRLVGQAVRGFIAGLRVKDAVSWATVHKCLKLRAFQDFGNRPLTYKLGRKIGRSLLGEASPESLE